jgi:hypothetical protein
MPTAGRGALVTYKTLTAYTGAQTAGGGALAIPTDLRGTLAINGVPPLISARADVYQSPQVITNVL